LELIIDTTILIWREYFDFDQVLMQSSFSGFSWFNFFLDEDDEFS